MFSLFTEPTSHISTPSTAGRLPALDPFANLVADKSNGVLRRGPIEGEAAIIEVLTGEMEGSPTPGVSPSRGGVADMPDRTLWTPSTTTLGAITLLAFLNLLGYIQNVLTGTNGRKKRSASFLPANTATLDEDSQLREERVPSRARVGFDTPLSGLIKDFVDYLLQEDEETPSPQENWKRQDQLLLPWSQFSQHRTAQLHTRRPILYRRTSLSRSSPPRPLRRATTQSTRGVGGFLSAVQHRLKLAASVMGFLNDPSPVRVRRAAELRSARHKRFTAAMNAWYDDLAGKNYDGTRHTSSGGGGGLLDRLMLGLGRRILGI